MTAHISTTVSWPTSKQVVLFQGREFLLLPATDDWVPGVAINLRVSGVESRGGARTALGRFASAICWFEQSKLAIDGFSYDAISPVHRRRQRLDILADHLFVGLREIEMIAEPRHLRALALYREGLSSSNDFYAALNFFKVIENFVEGKDREEWFNAAISEIRIPRILDRVAAIEAMQGKSVGRYLAEEGRGAVAHAKLKDAVDPDSDEARFQFSQDLQLFQALARSAINKFVGVSDGRSTARQQGNPIAGFFRSQHRDVLAWLRYRDRPIPNQSLVLPSPVSAVVVCKGNTVALRGMEVSRHGAEGEGLSVEILSRLGVGALYFHFDIRQKELRPVGSGLKILKQPDETFTREMLDELALLLEFVSVMWGNGTVWLIDEESGLEWGRTGQICPVNSMVDHRSIAPLVEQIGTLICRRSLDGK